MTLFQIDYGEEIWLADCVVGVSVGNDGLENLKTEKEKGNDSIQVSFGKKKVRKMFGPYLLCVFFVPDVVEEDFDNLSFSLTSTD